MKIAWVSYDFEEYSALHVNALAEQHEVMLVLPSARDDGPRYGISDRVHHLAFDKPRLRQPLRQWVSVRRLLKSIDDFAPDVVHLQQGHLWFNLAISQLKRNAPLVVTIHDPRHHAGDRVSQKTPQWVLDYGFRRADHVIVHGRALAEQVHDLFRLPHDHIHVIPHVAMGVTPPDTSTEAEQSNEVLFFGRIWDYKGLEYLIQAEPLISAEVPNLKIVIGGEGDDFGRYRQMMKHPERFEVHNRWISDEERADFFRRAALVVLPYNEATQSGVVPVAYNYSKPVVATDVGALSDCVHDQETGLLVPPRDPQRLAAAITRLLKNPAERQRMGEAAKALLDRQASPEQVALETAKVYAAACGQPAVNASAALPERQPAIGGGV